MNKVGSIEILFSGMCKGCGKANLDIHFTPVQTEISGLFDALTKTLVIGCLN